MERSITAVWREVLGVQTVGRNDNFFELGGNSVAMVQVYNCLRGSLAQELPMVALFEQPTVAALARYLSDRSRFQEAMAPGIEAGQDRATKRKEAVRRRTGRRGRTERSGDE
jgi:aryl carrier-like protein